MEPLPEPVPEPEPAPAPEPEPPLGVAPEVGEPEAALEVGVPVGVRA